MKSKPLLWQLLPANLIVILLALLALLWYGSATLRTLLHDQMRTDLEGRARLIESTVTDLIRDSPQELHPSIRRLGRNSASRITVIDPAGKVLADSREDPAKMASHADRPEFRAALAGRIGANLRFSNTMGEDMYFVAIPLMAASGEQTGALRLGASARSAGRAMQLMNLKLALGGLILAALAGIFSLLVSRRIGRSLAEMKRGAEKLARGETDNIIALDDLSLTAEETALARALNRVGMHIRERLQTIGLQRNELEAVFSSMTDMVLAIDTEKRIIRINRSAAALLYLSPEDVQGKQLQGVIRSKDLHEIVDKVLSSGTASEQEIIIFVGADKLYLQTRATPLVDEEGQPIGVLVVLNDLTRMHRLTNLRRDFVANVSHELKTPVTSIRGYVETLLDGALDKPEDARRFLEIVARQSARLDSIIDDLLLLSRIELKSEQQEISLEQVKVHEVLASAVQTCRPRAAAKNIRIDTVCDESLAARLNPNLIEQAVINLLTNAVTYSPEHTVVTVSAAEKERAGSKDLLVISVEDHGIGIERDQVERLFERFYRTDKARSSASGGTGLGLSIVKHIAIAHKGSVAVQSEPGQGSTFSLVLPQ